MDFIVDGNTVGQAKQGDSFGELALMYFSPVRPFSIILNPYRFYPFCRVCAVRAWLKRVLGGGACSALPPAVPM